MPTILTHPAVPLALAACAGRQRVGVALLMVGVVASMLPDADVLAFRLGVAYGSEFGHRGFSHSLVFALGVAFFAALFASRLSVSRITAFMFVALSCASHGLLDMFTNGGHGIAYLWPFSEERFFSSYQVIEVSTLSLKRFISQTGASVLASEVRWVWIPAIAVAVSGLIVRRRYTAWRMAQLPVPEVVSQYER